MKTMKKVLALALAAIMVMALAGTALAASITITTDATLEGTTANTYKAYKIFDAQYTSLSGANTQADKDTFNYPANAKVAYFMKNGNPWILTVQGMANIFTVTAAADGSGYTVELKDGVESTADTAKSIASTLKAALTGLSLNDEYAGKDVTAGGDAITVDPGYYLIASDIATNLQLITTDVTMVEKNEYIHDEKVAETASVSVGESATYYIAVYLPANIDTTLPVVIHDDLADELSFNNDVKYYISATDPAAGAADKVAVYKTLTYSELTSAYTVKTAELTDGCDFEISINTNAIAGKYIVFQYSAELLATAASDTGYVNKEFTTYSNYETNPSTPQVKTYDFDIKKVDENGAELTGAVFQVKKENSTTAAAIQFFAVNGGYKKADTKDATTADATKVTDLEAGSINIAGLGAGTYYLFEITAPTGFNKLEAPVIIEIADDGTITASYNGTALDNVSDLFSIENKSGTVLPSTGGIGTTIFYIVGAILVLGAGAVLVARRKASAK